MNMLQDILHNIGAYIPEWLIGFIVGFIFSPLIIYGIMEYIENRRLNKMVAEKIEYPMTKKELKEKISELIDEIDKDSDE